RYIVTVEPAGASTPAPGWTSTPFPLRLRTEVFWVSRCTWKPADTRRDVAVCGSRPITFGTTWPAPGFGPSEALSVIRVPTFAVEPPPGDCETTAPCGWSDGT